MQLIFYTLLSWFQMTMRKCGRVPSVIIAITSASPMKSVRTLRPVLQVERAVRGGTALPVPGVFFRHLSRGITLIYSSFPCWRSAQSGLSFTDPGHHLSTLPPRCLLSLRRRVESQKKHLFISDAAFCVPDSPAGAQDPSSPSCRLATPRHIPPS